MIAFITGCFVGGVVGAVLMALVRVNPQEEYCPGCAARNHLDAVAWKRARRSQALYKVGL